MKKINLIGFSFNIKYVFLFLLYLYLSNKDLAHILFVDIGHNSKFKLMVFFCATVLSFIFIYFLFQIKNLKLRLIICLPLVLSSFISETFYDISGNTINIDDIEIAILNTESWLDFAFEFKDNILPNAIILILGTAIIFYPYNSRFLVKKKFNQILLIFGLLFFLSSTIISFKRGGYGLQGFPSQLKVLIPFPLLLLSENLSKIDFELLQSKKNRDNVILIIDESVSYDFFVKAKNLADFDNSLFKEVRKFYSIHNCSAQSVFSLINGLKFEQDDFFLRENLWSVAKRGGYKTVYLSAQEKANKYQYLQKPYELMKIDEKYFFGNIDNVNRDKEILKKLLTLIKEDSSQFIVVIKNGSHYPYKSKFEYKKYNLAQDDENELFYLYSIKENSVNFLKKLFLNANPTDRFFYISDHGQNLVKDEITHCNSSNPRVKEWEIPILLHNIHNDIANSIKTNFLLYDAILKVFGYENSVEENRKKILLYGSISKRFGKKIKYKRY